MNFWIGAMNWTHMCDSNSMICLQVIGFSCLTLITLNLVMFSYREVILDNPGSLARVGFIERERGQETY